MHPGLFIGREIDGYKIQKVIGRGGMGVVFRAVDVMLDRTVAIKLVNPAYVNEKSFVRRLGREARALARLQSPHIVTIHALRRTEIGLFIVMEYVDGQTLSEWAEGQPVPWADLRPVLRQTLTALGHAHTLGVVHRDIKPANIMLTMSGRVKMMDFGIAKVLAEETATATQGITGTLYYMSPEQVERPETVDGRSDLYSLGMTAYRLLTAELPFEEGLGMMSLFRAIVEEDPPPIRSLNADVPPAAAALIERVLQKDPERRFQTAGEMLKALEVVEDRYEAPTAVELAVDEHEESDASPSRWRRWVLATVVLMAVVGGVVAAGMSLVMDEGNPPLATATLPPEIGSEDEAALGLSKLTDSTSTSGGGEAGLPGEDADADLERSESEEPEGEASDSVAASGAAAADETTGEDETPEEVVTPEGVAVVQSNPGGARVYIDGQDWGRTPARVTLPVGQYQARLSRDGYAPASVNVRVVDGEETELDTRLVPAYGTLVVIVRPYGDVYIDGELRQEDVGPAQSFELPTGWHTVQVRHPQLGTREQRVRIGMGEDVRVYMTLLEE